MASYTRNICVSAGVSNGMLESREEAPNRSSSSSSSSSTTVHIRAEALLPAAGLRLSKHEGVRFEGLKVPDKAAFLHIRASSGFTDWLTKGAQWQSSRLAVVLNLEG